MEAAESDDLTVFWIYLSHCLYEHTAIARYQAAYDLSKSLADSPPAKRQAVLREICQKLIEIAPASDSRSQAPASLPLQAEAPVETICERGQVAPAVLGEIAGLRRPETPPYKVSDAKSANLDRSPRRKVKCAPYEYALKWSTT